MVQSKKKRWQAFMAKKKAEDMREQLRTMITYTRGASAWQELIKMEADIRVKRQKAIYAQKERQRFWIECDYCYCHSKYCTCINRLVCLVCNSVKRLLMLFLLAIVISGGLIAIGWVIYLEDFVMTREFHMPETDIERKVVDIKERIKVAEWRLKKLVGEQ